MIIDNYDEWEEWKRKEGCGKGNNKRLVLVVGGGWGGGGDCTELFLLIGRGMMRGKGLS